MNTFTAPARLTAAPEIREVKGHQVLNMRLAVNSGFGSNESTLYMNAAKWGNGVEALAGMLNKGSFVVVAGELSEREYEKDGQTRKSLELRVDRLDLGPKVANDGSSPAPAQSDDEPDEIPF